MYVRICLCYIYIYTYMIHIYIYRYVYLCNLMKCESPGRTLAIPVETPQALQSLTVLAKPC